MENDTRNIRFFFFIVCLIGLVLVTTELVFQIFNTSICTTEGCKIASDHTRFGTISILIPGIVVFLTLAFLSKQGTWRNPNYSDRIITMLLNVTLAAEGFLVGYQAFRLQSSCTFCIIIFVLFIILALLWFAAGNRDVATGFISFVVILSFLYMILPPQNQSGARNTHYLGESTFTLFYDDSCKSCEEIENLCKECDIKIDKLDAQDHIDLLTCLGIQQLPVLVVNEDTGKRVIVGQSRIEEYIFSILGGEKGKGKGGQSSVSVEIKDP